MKLNFCKQLIPIALTLVVGGFANADTVSFSNTPGQTGDPGFADAFTALNGTRVDALSAASPVVVPVTGNSAFPDLAITFVGATSPGADATFQFFGTRSGITSGIGASDGQSGTFGNGESLSFFFSEDVEITVAEFGGFGADEEINFNGAPLDNPGNANELEFFDPPLFIAAGSTLTIAGVEGSNVGISTIDFTPVAGSTTGVPEPSSAALLGLLSVGVVARRRRR